VGGGRILPGKKFCYKKPKGKKKKKVFSSLRPWNPSWITLFRRGGDSAHLIDGRETAIKRDGGKKKGSPKILAEESSEKSKTSGLLEGGRREGVEKGGS